MQRPMSPSQATAERYAERARYLRTLALTASTADVSITLVQLALHYERLSREQTMPQTPPAAPTSDA